LFITRILYLCTMKKGTLYTVLLFVMCILYTSQVIVNEGYQISPSAKFNIASLLKTKNITDNNFTQQRNGKQDFIFACSESKVIFNSQNEHNNVFLSFNNKEKLYNHCLASYISKMRSNTCNKRSLSQLNILLI
jgi:hypothetical protein